MLAFSLWKRNRMEELPAQGAPVQRVRAMAIAGMVLSAGFFLVIVANLYPSLSLRVANDYAANLRCSATLWRDRVRSCK